MTSTITKHHLYPVLVNRVIEPKLKLTFGEWLKYIREQAHPKWEDPIETEIHRRQFEGK